MSNKQALITTINARPEELHIMAQEEFHELTTKLRNNSSNIDPELVASLISPAQDVFLIRRLINEVGLTGRAVAKKVDGKVYIISLKGIRASDST